MRKEKMETSTELGSTTRVVVRLWSAHYYHKKYNKAANLYDGIVADVVTGKRISFHSPAEMLKAIEYFYSRIEILRIKTKAPQTTNPKHMR